MPDCMPVAFQHHRKEHPPYYKLRKRYKLAQIIYHPGKRREQYVKHSYWKKANSGSWIGYINIAAKAGVCSLRTPDANFLNVFKVYAAFRQFAHSKVNQCQPDHCD